MYEFWHNFEARKLFVKRNFCVIVWGRRITFVNFANPGWMDYIRKNLPVVNEQSSSKSWWNEREKKAKSEINIVYSIARLMTTEENIFSPFNLETTHQSPNSFVEHADWIKWYSFTIVSLILGWHKFHYPWSLVTYFNFTVKSQNNMDLLIKRTNNISVIVISKCLSLT